MMKESPFPLKKSLVENVIDKVLQDENDARSREGRASVKAAASVVTTSSSMSSSSSSVKGQGDDDDNGLSSSTASTTSSSPSSSGDVLGVPSNKKQKVEEETTMATSWTSLYGDRYKVRQTKDDDDWNTIMSMKVPKKQRLAGEAATTVGVIQDKTTRAKNSVMKLPMYFGIQILQTHQQQKADEEGRGGEQRDAVVVGFITFYIAYSTWDGRFLFVDHIRTSSNKQSNNNKEGDITATSTTTSDEEETMQAKMEIYLLQLVSKIAIELQCSRVTWTITKVRF